MKELPQLNAAVLCFDKGFTSEKSDSDYYYCTDLPQTPRFRFHAMDQFFSLLESLRHPIQDLGIRNLQADNPKDPKTLAKIGKVLSGLLSLRLSITSETNDAAPEHDLEVQPTLSSIKMLFLNISVSGNPQIFQGVAQHMAEPRCAFSPTSFALLA